METFLLRHSNQLLLIHVPASIMRLAGKISPWHAKVTSKIVFDEKNFFESNFPSKLTSLYSTLCSSFTMDAENRKNMQFTKSSSYVPLTGKLVKANRIVLTLSVSVRNTKGKISHATLLSPWVLHKFNCGHNFHDTQNCRENVKSSDLEYCGGPTFYCCQGVRNVCLIVR